MKANDKTCYLEYVDGYLTCTINHHIGTPCLMDEKNMELKPSERITKKVEESRRTMIGNDASILAAIWEITLILNELYSEIETLKKGK